MGRNRFEAEFGSYTSWLVDAIEALDLDDPVPAACRGTANPSLLEHLSNGLDLKPGMVVLDIGIGIGGPAAWLSRSRDCSVVGVDVMQAAAVGVKRLFPHVTALVASTRALPFPSASFHAAWSLGVVEMIQDKRSAFAEIHRVLRPGGRLAVYDFVAQSHRLSSVPLADRFSPAAFLAVDLESAGFTIVESRPPGLPDPPPEWRDAVERVRESVRETHEGEETLTVAENERQSFNQLRLNGDIVEWEFILERRADD